MRAGAQTRTLFAGLGVTGCLVAAIAVAFAVTGGVLAFSGWPDAPSPKLAPALSVAAARAAGHRAAPPLSLATAAPAASAAASGTARGAAGKRPAGHDAGTGRPGTHAVPPPGPGGGPVVSTPAPPSPPASPSGVAPAGRSVTDTAAKAVRSVGTAVPAVAPVTGTLAGTIDQLGHALWPAAQRLAAPR